MGEVALVGLAILVGIVVGLMGLALSIVVIHVLLGFLAFFLDFVEEGLGLPWF